MTPAVTRRLLAEFTGTGLLVAIVAGSGIAVTRLTSDGAARPVGGPRVLTPRSPQSARRGETPGPAGHDHA